MANTLRSKIAEVLKSKGFSIVEASDLLAVKQGAIKNDFIYVYRAETRAMPNNSMSLVASQEIKTTFHVLMASKNERDSEDANELKSLEIRTALMGYKFNEQGGILNYVGGKSLFERNQALWIDVYEITENEQYPYSSD